MGPANPSRHPSLAGASATTQAPTWPRCAAETHCCAAVGEPDWCPGGGIALMPAGNAIAPAKQHQARVLLIKVSRGGGGNSSRYGHYLGKSEQAAGGARGAVDDCNAGFCHRPCYFLFLDGSGKSTSCAPAGAIGSACGLAFWDDVVVLRRHRRGFVHKVYGSSAVWGSGKTRFSVAIRTCLAYPLASASPLTGLTMESRSRGENAGQKNVPPAEVVVMGM